MASGVWPIVHMRSFEWITGPKTDHWLVKMVGALAVADGVVLGRAARRETVSPDAVTLSVATAAAFAAVDIIYVAQGRIRPIYLADAVLEAVMIALILGSEDVHRKLSGNDESSPR